jgi:hypothetical protein
MNRFTACLRCCCTAVAVAAAVAAAAVAVVVVTASKQSIMVQVYIGQSYTEMVDTSHNRMNGYIRDVDHCASAVCARNSRLLTFDCSMRCNCSLRCKFATLRRTATVLINNAERAAAKSL